MIDLSPQNSQISGMQQRSTAHPQHSVPQQSTQNTPTVCGPNSTSPLCSMGEGVIVGGSGIDSFPQSLKHLLTQNLGRRMLATFLIGTQNNMLLHGVLTDVGNDYIVLYDADRDSYITGDYYALKFVEFMPEEGQKNTAP